jgi:hypothetical protein
VEYDTRGSVRLPVGYDATAGWAAGSSRR